MNKRPIRIGIIGNFDAAKTSLIATNYALAHAAEQLSLNTNIDRNYHFLNHGTTRTNNPVGF